jgi:CO/xanthine dehydrogenase FAD-binding subunit
MKASLTAMGVDAAPVRLKEAESELLRHGLDAAAIDSVTAAAWIVIEPMADPYTTAAYRKHAVGALIKKALTNAAVEATR